MISEITHTNKQNDSTSAETSNIHCKPCRKKKLKCDRLLPQCSRCQLNNIHCEYVKKSRFYKFQFKIENPKDLKLVQDSFQLTKTIRAFSPLDPSHNDTLLSPLYRAKSVDEIIQFAFNYPYTNYYQIGNSLRTDKYLNDKIQYSLDRYPLPYTPQSSKSPDPFFICTLSPIARPLYLLTQQTFWNELIELFIQNFHYNFPIFSLRYFDPQKAPTHLMATIYLVGHLYRPDTPRCVTEYLEQYAELATRRCLYSPSISALQALFLMAKYTHYTNEGTKCKMYQSHLTRLSYMMGIHQDLKRSSTLRQYEAQIVWSKVIILNLLISGVSFAPNYIVNYPQFLTRLNPDYQLPHPSYNFDHKHSQVASMVARCITEFILFYDVVCAYYWDNIRTANHVERISQKLKTGCDKGILEHDRTCRFYDELLLKYPNYKEIIIDFKIKSTLYFCTMDIHYFSVDSADPTEIMVKKIDRLIQSCSTLIQTLIADPVRGQFYTTGLLIASGLAYLKGLKFATKSQSKIILRDLEKLTDWILSHSYESAKLACIILKYGRCDMNVNSLTPI